MKIKPTTSFVYNEIVSDLNGLFINAEFLEHLSDNIYNGSDGKKGTEQDFRANILVFKQNSSTLNNKLFHIHEKIENARNDELLTGHEYLSAIEKYEQIRDKKTCLDNVNVSRE